jgi:hypothetical protein
MTECRPTTFRRGLNEALLRPRFRDDSVYVLETFQTVRKNDVKAHAEYRTKRLILDAYDHVALAARSFTAGLGATGSACQTMLDRPPADPRVAHPDTRPESP